MAAEPQWRCVTAPQSRRPIAAAALAVVVGQTWVSHSLALRPVWVFPGIATVLLVASIVVYESRAEPPRAARALSYSFVVVLVAANAASLALLVRDVFVGSRLGPAGLLAAGVALWLVNVAVFALMYWEVDGGGPESRAGGYEGRYPDLVFPQQQADQQGIAPPTWKPSFSDYLYVSLTGSIAFSPTDVMPYTMRAKLVMGTENLLGFAILAVVVARAVNIAHG